MKMQSNKTHGRSLGHSSCDFELVRYSVPYSNVLSSPFQVVTKNFEKEFHITLYSTVNHLLRQTESLGTGKLCFLVSLKTQFVGFATRPLSTV